MTRDGDMPRTCIGHAAMCEASAGMRLRHVRIYGDVVSRHEEGDRAGLEWNLA